MIRLFRYNEIDRSEIFSRDIASTKNVEAIVTDIIQNVIARKDAALLEYCEKFDKVKLTSLEVRQEEIEEAVASVEPKFLEILQKAAENIYAFHSRQDIWLDTFAAAYGFGVVLADHAKVDNLLARYIAKSRSLRVSALFRLENSVLWPGKSAEFDMWMIPYAGTPGAVKDFSGNIRNIKVEYSK